MLGMIWILRSKIDADDLPGPRLVDKPELTRELGGSVGSHV